MTFQLHNLAGILNQHIPFYSVKETHSLLSLREDRQVWLTEQVDFESQVVELDGLVS